MDYQYNFHLNNGDNGNLYTAQNNRDPSRTQSYTYDTLNRILTAQTQGTLNSSGQLDCSIMVVPGGSQTKYWGESFTYDPWGNLTGKASLYSPCTAENTPLAANSYNQLAAYTYDVAGNMINNGGATYAYDAESELASAGGYTYLYDGDGNRIGKTNGASGTLYWYGSPGIVEETDLSGTPQSEYVFFGGQRVARRDISSLATNEYYYFSNQIHSTALITDVNGTIEDDADYYPWGGTLMFSSQLANNYWFSGKLRDQETGLDYFGARYYGNTFGRFTTPDWSAKVQGVPYADFNDPQSLNLYGYVRDNPISRIDPDGHCPAGATNCADVQVTVKNPQQNVQVSSVNGVKDKDGVQHSGVGPNGTVQEVVTVKGKAAGGVDVTENNQRTKTVGDKTTHPPVKEGEATTKKDGKFLDIIGSTNNVPQSEVGEVTKEYNNTPVTITDKQTLTLTFKDGTQCSATTTKTLTNVDKDGKASGNYKLTVDQPKVQQ